MNALEKGILEDFKRRVAERLPLARMVLFGSRARGDDDPDSDMDVLVVLDCPADWSARRIVSDCAWEASVCKGIILTPLSVCRSEWEDGPESVSLLAVAVRREGIPV